MIIHSAIVARKLQTVDSAGSANNGNLHLAASFNTKTNINSEKYNLLPDHRQPPTSLNAIKLMDDLHVPPKINKPGGLTLILQNVRNIPYSINTTKIYIIHDIDAIIP